MQKIPAVETAKQLMSEAVTWSVMKWLREKKTVRKIADQANTALDQLNQAVKSRWPDDIKLAYDVLVHPKSEISKASGNQAPTLPQAPAILALKKVKDSDDDARRARADAEDTFDLAEKQLSTAVAREGCRKAIRSWDLHEKAIRRAEELIRST